MVWQPLRCSCCPCQHLLRRQIRSPRLWRVVSLPPAVTDGMCARVETSVVGRVRRRLPNWSALSRKRLRSTTASSPATPTASSSSVSFQCATKARASRCSPATGFKRGRLPWSAHRASFASDELIDAEFAGWSILEEASAELARPSRAVGKATLILKSAGNDKHAHVAVTVKDLASKSVRVSLPAL